LANLPEELSYWQDAMFTNEPRDLNRQRHKRDEVDEAD
jgi:hypothetical protein